MLARRARSRWNSSPSSAAIAVTWSMIARRPLGAAELAGVGLDDRLRAPERRRRVELERAVHDVDVDAERRVVGQRGERALEAAACRCSTTGRRRRTRPRHQALGAGAGRGVASAAVTRHGATLRPYRPGAMTPSEPAAGVQATFCATLVDEWVASRRRPRRRRARLAQHPDGAGARRSRRSGGARRARRAGGGVRRPRPRARRRPPALLLCTSGTAAANFHPAVVEAGLSDVPMLVLTADRPPELRDVGAPQTIDQTHLFGRLGAVVPRPRRPRRRPIRRRGAPLAARSRARPRRAARCTSTCRSASRCSARSGRSLRWRRTSAADPRCGASPGVGRR